MKQAIDKLSRHILLLCGYNIPQDTPTITASAARCCCYATIAVIVAYAGISWYALRNNDIAAGRLALVLNFLPTLQALLSLSQRSFLIENDQRPVAEKEQQTEDVVQSGFYNRDQKQKNERQNIYQKRRLILVIMLTLVPLLWISYFCLSPQTAELERFVLICTTGVILMMPMLDGIVEQLAIFYSAE